MAVTKIALLQMSSEFLQVDQNVSKAARMVREAAANGAQLIMLPELYNTGWRPNREAEMAGYEEPLDGPTLTIMSELAKELRVWIITPILLKNEGGKKPSNASILVNDQGHVVHVYGKTHPVRSEAPFIERGRDYSVCDTPFGKLGFMICNDISFPECARLFALNGADILCVTSAWHGMSYLIDWKIRSLACRALDNLLFVASVNQCGKSENGYFAGYSSFFDPRGNVMNKAGIGEEILYNTIDTERIAVERDYNTSLFDRHPEDYGPLAK